MIRESNRKIILVQVQANKRLWFDSTIKTVDFIACYVYVHVHAVSVTKLSVLVKYQK